MIGTLTKARARRGYTLVEVMTAVAVMTVGASGIAAMLTVNARANQAAQETTVAVSIGQTMVDRIRRDALLWTAPGNLAGTVYLQQAPGAGLVPAWYTIPPAAPTLATELASFDLAGFDAPAGPRVQYCVSLNNAILHQTAGVTDMLRVDIRVWWTRVRGQRPVCVPAPCTGYGLQPDECMQLAFTAVVQPVAP